MTGILWRVVVAVLSCLIAYALIPPVSRIIGFPLDGDVLLVLKICIGAIALFYILRGPMPPWVKA
jgi:hypothetical protein